MMANRFALFIFLASLGVALIGCGGDPTAGTMFRPPAGWQPTPGMFGWKMWINKNKSQSEVVMLFKFPTKGDVKLTDIDFSKNPYYKGGSVIKEQRITICGGHPAQYLFAHGTADNGKGSSDAEMIFSNWGQDTYMALYARSKATKPDPAAEAAIRSVCLKK